MSSISTFVLSKLIDTVERSVLNKCFFIGLLHPYLHCGRLFSVWFFPHGQIGLVEPLRIIKTITFMKPEMNLSTFDPPEKEDSPTIAQLSRPFTDLCIKLANTITKACEQLKRNQFRNNVNPNDKHFFVNILSITVKNSCTSAVIFPQLSKQKVRVLLFATGKS